MTTADKTATTHIGHPSGNGTGPAQKPGDAQGAHSNVSHQPGNRFASFLATCANAYGGSLLIVGVIIPILASVVTVSLYFAPPVSSLPILDPRWYAPVYGLLYAHVVWLVVALPCCYFATVEGANARSYGILRTRLSQLKARLGIHRLHDDPAPGEAERQMLAEMDTQDAFRLIALREAHACYTTISKSFWEARTGVQWALGTGYINSWIMLHRVEEALIEVEPKEMVIRGAMHDKLAIQNSTISSREELLEKLIQAVKELSPAAAIYFKEHQPNIIEEDILELRQGLARYKKILGQLAHAVQDIKKQDPPIIVDDDDDVSSGTDTEALKAEAHAQARVTLREVRRTLNEFRDNLWEGLVRARNQLLGTIALTGIVTHVLLCIPIMTTDPKVGQSTVLAATAFYMVGAIAGLFGRFYKESGSSTAVDDYGLSIARLIAVPLLSGLAGIGGVLITAMLAVLNGQHVTLGDIFSIDPRHLLAAAVFGLTPNLLIKSLQDRADKYASDIQSSKSAGQSKDTGN